MKCKICESKMKVLRGCWKVRLKCTKCGKEFHIHEVADRLDAETEELLANYPTIIYD